MKFSIKNLKVSQRLAAMIGLAVAVVITQAVLGLYELSNSNNSLKTVYEDRMVPVNQLFSIEKLMNDSDNRLKTALSEVKIDKSGITMNPEIATQSADIISKNIEASDVLWKEYIATYLTPEEKILANKYVEVRSKFVNGTLIPEVSALRTNNYGQVKKIIDQSSDAAEANGLAADALIKLQFDVASSADKAAVVNYSKVRLLTFAGLASAILILVLLGILLVRSISRALGGEPSEINHAASRMAAGDVNFDIKLASNDKSSAMLAMHIMQNKVKLLISDASMLSTAAVEGKLSTRADATQHQGDFRKVVEGVNATLDAVIGPLNVAANYVDRISKGDIPTNITENYNGDFNAIKNNLNACIEAVNKMAADTNMLSQAAVEGKLSIRADASQHKGDFRKIVEGVNHTLDAVIGPLNVAAGYVDKFAKGSIPAKITESYSGDFNIIKDNLNACVDALNLLVSDANMLAQAAQDNKLDTRADVSKHWGDYRKVVEGVNGTLDTVMDKNAADAAEKAKEAQVLSNAVEETQGIIENAKAGDLSSRVPLAGKTGAIASLCDGVNALMDKMTEVIVQVRDAGETINTAAGEISSGNNDLSQRTEQQASSLEETAASMEELASTVKNNTENAKQANQLAIAASGIAVKGGEVVSQVVNTMSAINTSAKKIEDIISVIDGIAFQTNILALNAAVEAARAGEQGRGFAVVAGEVRNLAQRSATAAKEIKDLIADSVSKTAEGTSQVEQAGKTMTEIVSSVQRVTDIMSEITAASVEQSAGIDQVNQAVTSMDEVTQQNAALVEEAAAASESLVEQAESLMQVVSVFNLGSQVIPDRRATNSPMRTKLHIENTTNLRTEATRPINRKTLKVAVNGSMNNGDWAEF